MKNKNIISWVSILIGIAFISYAVSQQYSMFENIFRYNPAWHLLKKMFPHFESTIVPFLFGIVLITVSGRKVIFTRKKARRQK